MKMRILSGVVLAGALALPLAAADYSIMAPAAPGGGWDQTARTMQAALQDEGISGNVQVTNVPGAGGTIGLAQFVNQAKGDPEALIVGGYVMVGAILTNKSPVDLSMVTPIARLTGEQVAIVAPADGPIQSHGRPRRGAEGRSRRGVLGRRLGGRRRPHHRRADRQGGRRRSDQGQLHRLLRRRRGAGGDPRRPGHGRACRAYGEFASQIEAGQLKLLAVSGESRIEGVDAPTLKEAGVDVVLENWRMVAAAPDLTDEQKAAITADIDKMATSEAWKKALADRGWVDRYLAGEAFDAQLAADTEATSAILKDIGLVQ